MPRSTFTEAIPPESANPSLITFSNGGESRQPQQSVFNPNARKPAGWLFRAIDHLTQEAIVVVIDRHQRAVLDGLVEPELGPAIADVSDLTVQNLDACSKHVDDHRSTGLMALVLSLVRLTIERDCPIRDDGLQAHDTCSAFPAEITIDRESRSRSGGRPRILLLHLAFQFHDLG